MNVKWSRVTKAHPCRVCKHPDWCTVSEIGSCCMRISEGGRPMKNGGYLHPIGVSAKPLPPRAVSKPVTIDAPAIMGRFYSETWPEMKEQLAASLGVTLESLEAIGCAWAVGHNAWAFPMKDWQGNTIGIRLRDASGHKWAVLGSRSGLFYAEGEVETAYITEGPTDTAAAISIGLDAVGRPSCMGSETELNRLLHRKKARKVVIISDNDEDKSKPDGSSFNPGQDGASRLSQALELPNCIFVPPAKDIRAAVNLGMTRELVESMVKSIIWTVPKNDCNAHRLCYLGRHE